MAKPPIDPEKVVVFSGAGISAESGISTYRDANGLWAGVNPNAIASKTAWEKNPQKVLEFFNERMKTAALAEPNAAHHAVKDLEDVYEVVVITQNVDDLHERAGSKNIIHLHGSLMEARGDSKGSQAVYRGAIPIRYDETDDFGNQLRPNVVLFGEDMMHADESIDHIKTAGKIIVVGTSLNVYPAAGLLKKARYHSEKIIVSLEVDKIPFGFQMMRGKATEIVPSITRAWLASLAESEQAAPGKPDPAES